MKQIFMYKYLTILLIMLSGLVGGSLLHGQKIFPGAEGKGTFSLGAYGGEEEPRVVIVDNLGDSGPGSFRYAVTRPFPRIVVFEVSGDIRLKSRLVVRMPNLQIAGQTAPGKGVAIWGHPFIVATHDVLVQDMRFRLGAGHEKQSDCATIGGTPRRVHNVVFDRCSFAFGLDETFTILHAGPDITISNSIIGYSLNALEHSCGMLVLNAFDVSIIRNVFAFNADRNPTVRGDSRRIEILNNLIYNSASHAVYLGSRGSRNLPVEALIEGNHYITGPDNMNRYLLSVHENVADSLTVYWADNRTMHGGRDYIDYQSQLLDVSDRFVPADSRPFPRSAEKMISPRKLPESLFAHSGARAGERDAVDSLIIDNIINRGGFMIDSEKELDVSMDLPFVKRKFQMPDNPHNISRNGFTNLQLYLHDLLLAHEKSKSPYFW